MVNLQFLPRCGFQVPGTEKTHSFTRMVVTAATSGAIGALGARLVTHLSPRQVGELFAATALVNVVIKIAMEFLKKPKNETHQALLALATGGMYAAFRCQQTIVPLTITSTVLLSTMTTAATLFGSFVAVTITKK